MRCLNWDNKRQTSTHANEHHSACAMDKSIHSKTSGSRPAKLPIFGNLKGIELQVNAASYFVDDKKTLRDENQRRVVNGHALTFHTRKPLSLLQWRCKIVSETFVTKTRMAHEGVTNEHPFLCRDECSRLKFEAAKLLDDLVLQFV